MVKSPSSSFGANRVEHARRVCRRREIQRHDANVLVFVALYRDRPLLCGFGGVYAKRLDGPCHVGERRRRIERVEMPSGVFERQ